MWRKLETCATFPHRQTARKIRRSYARRAAGDPADQSVNRTSRSKITLKPLKHQIDDTIEPCRERVKKNERVLVTTLTKRTAKDLAGYLI
jgi:hypothetical protein